MRSHHYRLWLALGSIMIIVVLILIKQIDRTRNISTTVDDRPLISPNAVEIPIGASDPLLGNPGAPLTIIAYLDLGDENSQNIYKTVASLVKKDPTKTRFYFKDYPTEHYFSRKNIIAHQAAFCAAEQEEFWEFTSALIAKKSINEAALRAAAKSAGLNIDIWWNCTQSTGAQNAVSGALAAARALGVPQSPTILINNHIILNSPDLDLAEFLKTFVE